MFKKIFLISSLFLAGCSETISHNYTQRICVDSPEKVITVLKGADKLVRDKGLVLSGISVYRDTFKYNDKRHFTIVIHGNDEGEILKMEDQPNITL